MTQHACWSEACLASKAITDKDNYLNSETAFDLLIQMINFFPSEKAILDNIKLLGEKFGNFSSLPIFSSILQKWYTEQNPEITFRQLRICHHILFHYRSSIASDELDILLNCLDKISRSLDYNNKNKYNNSYERVFKECNNLICDAKQEILERKFNSKKKKSNNISANDPSLLNDDKKDSSENDVIKKNQKFIMNQQNRIINELDAQRNEINQIKNNQQEMMLMLKNMQMMMMQAFTMKNNSLNQQPACNSQMAILSQLSSNKVFNDDDKSSQPVMMQESNIMYPKNKNSSKTTATQTEIINEIYTTKDDQTDGSDLINSIQ